MNTSVNVLAVMHAAQCALEIYARREQADEVNEARAAVADLIAACESLQQHPDDLEIQAHFCNALARVKGA